MELSLAGKTVIVTGGGSNIGEGEIMTCLASTGAQTEAPRRI
jgi:NAD(P)-dependent dehydrogenase (short-subunit alcohol dehydrogenase family)